MSYSFRKWFLGLRGLSLLEYRVLDRLLDYANEETLLAWPAVATLAEQCEVSERGVQSSLTSFRNSGLIEVAAPASQHRPITYRINPGVQIQGCKRTQGCKRRQPGVQTVPSRGAAFAPEPLTEPSKEKPPSLSRAKPRDDGGISFSKGREARAPLGDDWLPSPETRAVAEERGLYDRLGEFLRKFGAYYGPDGEGSNVRLTAQGWQLKAQDWLRHDPFRSEQAAQRQGQGARAGRVAGAAKKTVPVTGTLEEHIGAWWSAADDDRQFAALGNYITLARLVVDEDTWRGDCGLLFGPFLDRVAMFSAGDMVEIASNWAANSDKGPPRSLRFFIGGWERLCPRMHIDRNGDCDGLYYLNDKMVR